jgi:hypothetical protein
MKRDACGGEDRIVVQHRSDIVGARNIRRGQHRHHPRRGAHRIEVHAEQLPGRDRCAADRDVQQSLGLTDIVDEDGAARDMFRRGVVAHRAAHDTQPHLFRSQIRLYRHPRPP